ncbi:hypothetical protein BsWGS_08578 [Bradybaena similaris]
MSQEGSGRDEDGASGGAQEAGDRDEDGASGGAQETGDRENDRDIDSLLRKLRDDFSRCAACGWRPRGTVNWPCSCVAHCPVCAQRLEDCSLCGRPVRTFSEVTIDESSLRLHKPPA